MDPHGSVAPTKHSGEVNHPESSLRGLEYDMARLSLEAENEELREKVAELQTELLDEKSQEKFLRREQVVETRQIREEEKKQAQSMVGEVRRKLYKEKQQEINELREKLLKEKDKDIAYLLKQKDEEFKKAQLNWNREKEDLLHTLRIKITNEIQAEARKSHEKQIRKLEVYIEELKKQKKEVQESCKLAQEADKNKTDQIRRMHAEHEQELGKLKRSSWQEGRQQMAEIRQLTNIIHQLEKKLGVESGHYVQLQLEKDGLRNKLDRIKGNGTFTRQTSLSASQTDLSSDLSFFSFPSGDDANPLWLQVKQQKCIIAQLKQNIQEKNRRIDLLKQRLFRSRKYGPSGPMHRSMDDLLTYQSEREDFVSPGFENSAGSSETSSLKEEICSSDDNWDVEIICRLQKEILQLQKAHSLLQAQNQSAVDVKRSQMDKEQLENDLLEAQRQIDELNKNLVECHDHNELLEFQLQESLQRNIIEGHSVSEFKIPTLLVDYQFSKQELFCSAEEVKARLEELQTEKKPVLNRDEQLTLERAKILLKNVATTKEHTPSALSCSQVLTLSDMNQKDLLQVPSLTESTHEDSLLDETDEYLPNTAWKEKGITIRDSELCEGLMDKKKCAEGVQIHAQKSGLENGVQLRETAVQTDSTELSLDSHVLDSIHCVEKIEAAIQCTTCMSVAAAQCNIVDVEDFNGNVIVKFEDEFDAYKFRKIMECKDIGVQSFPDEESVGSERPLREVLSRKDPGFSIGVNTAVQCNILELLNEENILVSGEDVRLCFKKMPVLCENAVQTYNHDVSSDDAIVGEKTSTCPHCGKPVFAAPGTKTNIIDHNGGCSLSPGGADASICPSFNDNEELDADDSDIKKTWSKFELREMCDFAVQFNESSVPPSDMPCLHCGYSKSSCNEVAIQCEFADLLSSSNGVLDLSELSGVFQADEGESLIQEVMALAKECSENDALIDQHLNEVVLGQDLYNQIQDGSHERGTDNDDDEWPEVPEEVSEFLSDQEKEMSAFLHQEEEYRDAQTQCGGALDEKAVQCSLLDDGKQFGFKESLTDKNCISEQFVNSEGDDYISGKKDSNITEKTDEPQSGSIYYSNIPKHDNGEEIVVVAEDVRSEHPTLIIDLDHVFYEMEAEPSNPIFPIALTPQQVDTPSVPDEAPNLFRVYDDIARSPAEEPTITQTLRADTLYAFEEAFSEDVSEVEDTVARQQLILPDSLQPNKDPVTQDNPPPSGVSVSQNDSPSALPDTQPPIPPPASPPSAMHDGLDDDIEAILAGEIDLDAGEVICTTQDSRNLSPFEEQNPITVGPTQVQEIETILASEDSLVRYEAGKILSTDGLYINQTPTVSNAEQFRNLNCYQNSNVFDDETETTSSYDDVMSGDVTNDDVLSDVIDDVSYKSKDRVTLASAGDLEAHSEKIKNTSHLQRSVSVGNFGTPVTESLGMHVKFQNEISESSTTETSSTSENRRQPPPVLPKPKHRVSQTEPPPVPTHGERLNSMAAQRDIVDGYFPPVGLVTKRASEFNLGEFDLLKERIIYLERQLKNKENVLQSMRAEATEIEMNAYIQKKEEDIKMMDESVRFFKVENQRKEKELIAKIEEFNRQTFELEQLKSEHTNLGKQREALEDNVHSLQERVFQLQSIQMQYQELRCKHDILLKENDQLHEQLNTLHRADEEFVELEKTISKLQDKLKELEDVKGERDDVCEQLRALKTQKDDLAQKGRKVETERNDFLMNSKLIQHQKENLEARNSALERANDTFKAKISTLDHECRELQRKLSEVQRARDEGSSQLRKLDAERSELRKRVNELIECKSELKQHQSRSQDLERELNYLRTQCRKIDSERTELSIELGKCLKERNRVAGRTAELEKLTSDNEKLEEKFHALKLKIAELSSQRDDAEVQLPTLKAKVALLKKACKDKDDQLEHLKAENRELKHSIASSALNDLSNLSSSPEKSVKFRDLNNNKGLISDSGKRFVVLFDYDPSRLSTTGHPEKELKLNEGDVVIVSSELDLNGYYMAERDGEKGLVSSLYVEEIDEYEKRRLKEQHESNVVESPPKKPEILKSPPRNLTNKPGLQMKHSFVAVKDYNPCTSSTSTRPDLEIPLNAGEVVTVVGEVDANGYYTVEKAGRLAIIPSNIVKPSSPTLSRLNKLNFTAPVLSTEQVRSQKDIPVSALNPQYPTQSSSVPRQSSFIHTAPPGSTPYSAKEITEHYVTQSSVENVLNTQNSVTGRVNRSKDKKSTASDLPSAPRNLRVLRCVNKDALLLGWLTPQIDELGRNNGQNIKGYKIFANGQAKLDVSSPYMAKALIENIDLTHPVELAIQTITETGCCSEKSLAYFNEAVMRETSSVTTEDISHVNNALPYKTCVALFSYDPLKSSPNPNPTLELEFQEGDIIRVLDTSRPDGYYTAQVNGNEGLVPSNFIEEIAVATSPDRYREEFCGSDTSLRFHSSLSPKKAKAMVALYDYNPASQSPNKHPDRELSFRKGQMIRVLGSVSSDGFFEADISGRRGLVPSSFLKPYKRKSTKSVASTNGVTSLPRRVQFEQDSREFAAGYV